MFGERASPIETDVEIKKLGYEVLAMETRSWHISSKVTIIDSGIGSTYHESGVAVRPLAKISRVTAGGS